MSIQKTFWRAPGNYDVKAASNEVCIKDFGPSMTIQSMTEDSDINVMMARMKIGNYMPPAMDKEPIWGDFTDTPDYRGALEAVNAANQLFMTYPARLRAEFDNDPGKFLAFTEDPANRARMKELGLLKPDAPEWKPSKDTEFLAQAIKSNASVPEKPKGA